MMPDDWKAQLSGMDAIYFGAVGWPATVPDHVSLWGSLLKFRREFDQYINLRPARTFAGVPCPLAGRGPCDIDFLIVRENTEGEYSPIGGVMFEGTPREVVIQESVFTRHGAERVLKFAFEAAAQRTRQHVTVATKSNGIAISMPWWDARAAEMAQHYPHVTWDKQHIDILCARFVMQPQRFDVVVASNLFGDILSDLGPACTGTIGLAPSANLNPERKFPSLFEPVHGSAPDIYGRNIANPVAMIWSGAMMLDFLGRGSAAARQGHDAIVTAIEDVLVRGPRTPDLGGNASTTEMGSAIAERVSLPGRACLSNYPIEIEFPDLTPYRAGNGDIPYVYSFDSGAPGPHVMVNALTHGNEVCGAIIVKALLDFGIRPRRGRLTLAFANVEAYERFDARLPDASRCIDQDFNRVWTRATLDDGSQRNIELQRARAMRPLIDTLDLLLDLHSMHERSAPLIVSGPLDKGIALARALGAPPTIISDAGHPEGRRLRDYESFGDPASPKNALLIECGQHWEAAAVGVARDSTARFLMLSGVVSEVDLPEGWLAAPSAAPRVIRVTDPVVATSIDFRFAGPYTGLELFADAGTVIGWNSGDAVVTPYPNCVLVMPSLRQLRPGVTVVRFGRLET